MASSSFFPPPEKTGAPFIFGPTQPSVAQAALKKNIVKKLEENEPNATFAWLIAEDGPGKLKIYYANFGQVGSTWDYKYGELSIIHTDKGWRLLGPTQAIDDKQISLDNIVEHNASLMLAIKKIPEVPIHARIKDKIAPLVNFKEDFIFDSLINPGKNQNSQTYAYSWQEAPKAFHCVGTGVVMTDPVTVVKPKSNHEIEGASYERSYLIERGYSELVPGAQSGTGKFVQNITLRSIIQAYNGSDFGEIHKAVEDPIGLEDSDRMQAAVLSPSGHSFSERTIKQWLSGPSKTDPITRANITANDLIPNLNLREFIEKDLPLIPTQQKTSQQRKS